VLAFSATYAADMQSRLESLMRVPQRVMLCQQTTALRAVRQFYVPVSDCGKACRLRVSDRTS
jgi:ATP-dependent RNA helicase DDX20